MFDDVINFRDFYETLLGQRAAAMIRHHIRPFWQRETDLCSAFIGYAAPFIDADATPIGMMPARRGAAIWPATGPVRTCLVQPDMLPLPDVHLDRLLLIHALEFEPDPGQFLDECWRVLDGAGRLFVVVPNRGGIWARTERTPFGHGQPYSGYQLRRLLQSHGFELRRMVRAVFMPPIASPMMLRFAPGIERIGSVWWAAMGGVLLVEADKILYAPSGNKRKLHSRASARAVLAGQQRYRL